VNAAAPVVHDPAIPGGDTVLAAVDESGIAWVYFNRPEKRNAMSPALNIEMYRVLDALEGDDRAKVVVLTGTGAAWSAGMDLKEYFRETDGKPRGVQDKVRRQGTAWQHHQLMNYAKPTIAMVNGWCFGGAIVPLVSCDIAVAADDAVFGVSEVNWGITPGNLVTRKLAEVMPARDAMFYIMTGESFDGRKAAQLRLVTEAVPHEQLRDRVTEIARKLTALSPWVLRGAKLGLRHARLMPWDTAEDYLYAKHDQAILFDEPARAQGLKGFLDDKSYRPGLGTYER
jgi:feruloyl-CoA hydratase/lyase